jgi:hypothetical protein
LIDRRLVAAAVCAKIAVILTLFGVIHSPFPDSHMFLPWSGEDFPATATGQTPFHFAAGYLVVAAILLAWSYTVSPDEPPSRE